MIKKILNRTWKSFLHNWLKRRIPRQSSHLLRHDNIFIVPSKTGLGFVVLIILLWLLGTNYQNNLILSVTFLLLALIVICIHHTYAQLSGLQISVTKTHPGFVGNKGVVDLLIKRQNLRAYESVELAWPGIDPITISLIDESQCSVSLSVPLTYRGRFQPERLKVSTHFPLGLIVAWSYLDFDAPVLAYPQPVTSSVQPTKQLLDDTDDVFHQPMVAGHEEFAGLREYYPGDSLRSIDWRAMARGQGLATRTYEDYVSQQYWFDWQQFEGMSREARLSRLCDSILQQENDSIYGLRLPGLNIEPGQGEEHRKQLLEALALFEWEKNI